MASMTVSGQADAPSMPSAGVESPVAEPADGGSMDGGSMDGGSVDDGPMDGSATDGSSPVDQQQHRGHEKRKIVMASTHVEASNLKEIDDGDGDP